MTKKLILTATTLLTLAVTSLKGEVLFTMIALENKATFGKEQLANVLNQDWGLKVDTSKIHLSEAAIAFELAGEIVGIVNMDIAIPWEDLEGACKFSFRWPNAAEQLKEHKAHLIPTIMTSKGPLLDRYKLLTKVTSSLLKLSQPIGVFAGNQQLVISAADYLSEADRLKEGKLPVSNWVLIGMLSKDNKTSAFTMGLGVFSYKEFEIIKSTKNLSDTYELLYNLVHYVIESNVKIKSGETVGFTQDQKIPVKLTSSVLFKGNKVLLLQH